MLFESDSPVPLVLAVGAVVVGVSAILAPVAGPLITAGRAPLALLLVGAAGLPAVVNLARYRRAPAGCAAVPLAFVAWGAAWAAGRSPVEQVVWLAAPNVALLGFEWGVRPALRWQAARQALGRLASEGDPVAVAAFLSDPSAAVRTAAARALGALEPRAAMAALEAPARADADETRAAAHAAIAALARRGPAERELAVALTHRVAGSGPPAAAEAAAGHLATLEERPARAWELLAQEAVAPAARVALAAGIAANQPVADGPALARALVAVAAASDAPDGARARALDVLGDAAPEDEDEAAAWRAEVAAAARQALTVHVPPGPELLWLLAEHGRPEDAPQVARWAGDELFARSIAAVEGTAGIVARTDALGAWLEPTCAALEQGRARVREVHPPGDNLLADRYVERIEHLLAVLAEEPPATEVSQPAS